MSLNCNELKISAKSAFEFTLSVFTGFWFIGLAYGIYMQVEGFSFIYPMLMSACIFGGSLEFVTVGMLLSPFAPIQSLIMALLIQARHLFYGISMLDKYKNMGLKKPFLIFMMCDETFAINYSAKIPGYVDRGYFMLFVSIFNYLYWFTGATMGGLLGPLISFETHGLEFVMTAMFVVIFLENFLQEKSHVSSYLGFDAGITMLVTFGKDNFMIPTMLTILIVLTVFKNKLQKRVA